MIENKICSSCGTKKSIQIHHLSPDIIIPLCKTCHTKVHHHGTGTTKDFIKQKKNIKENGYTPSFIYSKPHKLHKIGGGYAIFVPVEWFDAHNMDPDKIEKLQVDANRHVVIVNPKDMSKEYTKFSREVKKKKGE